MFLNFPEHRLLVNVDSIDYFEIPNPFEENGKTVQQLVIQFKHKLHSPTPPHTVRYVLFKGDQTKAYKIWETIFDKLNCPENVQTINTSHWTPAQ